MYAIGKMKNTEKPNFYHQLSWMLNMKQLLCRTNILLSTVASKFWMKTNGILLSKLFFPTVRKKYSSDQEKLLKLEAEGQEFANKLRPLEQFIQTVKGQNNFW
jgi:hypothetical protein